MEGLHFDAERHVYTKDGVRVPSVTQILGELSAREYRFVTREVMEDAAALGTAVHKMIELDLRDDLDVDSLSDTLTLYYGAWCNFLSTSGFQMMLSEQRVYSDKWRFAGTLDLSGTLNDRFCIIDAKRTAQVPRTAGPQTAAYLAALQSMPDDSLPAAAAGIQKFDANRYALHLRKNGTWRLIPFIDSNDLRVFLACKTLKNWSDAA